MRILNARTSKFIVGIGQFGDAQKIMQMLECRYGNQNFKQKSSFGISKFFEALWFPQLFLGLHFPSK